MTPQQYIIYGILAIIGLYLAYVVSTSIINLFWYLIQIVIYGGLLGGILWYLRKEGFFDLFKK
jgi:LytS/YehU family sensor histidine kinase